MVDAIGRPMTVRFYGKVLNTWTHETESGHTVATQYEIAYKEYDTETLELVAVGSEDFSPSRLKGETLHKGVFTWDGETYRRDGKRKFEYIGNRQFRKSERKAVEDYCRKLYGADVVQFRY